MQNKILLGLIVIFLSCTVYATNNLPSLMEFNTTDWSVLGHNEAIPYRQIPYNIESVPDKKVSVYKHNEQIIHLRKHSDKTAQTSSSRDKDPTIAADQALVDLETQLGWSKETQGLETHRVLQDSYGVEHVRYRQKKNNIPVYGSDVFVHLDDQNTLSSASFNLAENLNIDTIPTFSKRKAIQTGTLLWQRETGPYRPEYAEASLLIFAPGNVFNTENDSIHLVWRVVIGDTSKNSGFSYFIDAHDGSVIWKRNEIRSIDEKICEFYSHHSNHGGTGPFSCETVLNVADDCYWGRDNTIYADGDNVICSPFADYLPPYSSTNYPPDGTYEDTPRVYSYLNDSYNYLNNILGQNGPDNQGGMGGWSVSFPGTLYPYGQNLAYTFIENYNPSWDYPTCPDANSFQTRITFCGGMASLDITAHEYAHTIAAHAHMTGDNVEGATYYGETGALEESYCDLFGEAVEASVLGANDWLVGTNNDSIHPDIVMGALRNLADPGNLDNPMYTGGVNLTVYTPKDSQATNFYCGSDDQGGVHRNSHVPSFGLYLLSEGGTYNDCSVTGIGLDNMMEIFHLGLTQYFSQSETFNGAYLKLQDACRSIYCPPSNQSCIVHECEQLRIALEAVKMDLNSRCSGGTYPATCSDIDADGVIDTVDNCPDHPNPGQHDTDSDNIGDVCDMATFNLSLNQGWNLISVPINTTNKSISYLFAEKNISIYGYNDSWFVPYEIDYKLGYWVKANESQHIRLSGLEVTENITGFNNEWSLIGYPSLNETLIRSFVNNSNVYSYNGRWGVYNPQRSSNSLNRFKPGNGYWIKK